MITKIHEIQPGDLVRYQSAHAVVSKLWVDSSQQLALIFVPLAAATFQCPVSELTWGWFF